MLSGAPTELKELKDILMRTFGKELDQEFEITSFGKWKNELIETLEKALAEYKIQIQEFDDEKKKLVEGEDFSGADRIKYKIHLYKSRELTKFLTEYNILPKYGFPIDVVNLDVSSCVDGNGLDLSRDLKQAISDYAPGEKVIANNRMFTSRYIKKSIIKGVLGFNTKYLAQCHNKDCAMWNIEEINNKHKCKYCGEPISNIDWVESIEPRAGFIAENKSEYVPLKRPPKAYHSEDIYIGDKKSDKTAEIDCNGKTVKIKYSDNDEIMVKTTRQYYMCPLCGYAAENIPREHKGYNGHLCSGKMKKGYLFHVFNTDVVVVDFPEANDEAVVRSVLYAILNAMASFLNIDIKDLNGCLRRNANKNGVSYSVVLYDSVAGGAGHVKRMVKGDGACLFKLILQEAYNNLNICKCKSSCYSCLRSYNNQRYHDSLDRIKAIEFIKKFI